MADILGTEGAKLPVPVVPAKNTQPTTPLIVRFDDRVVKPYIDLGPLAFVLGTVVPLAVVAVVTGVEMALGTGPTNLYRHLTWLPTAGTLGLPMAALGVHAYANKVRARQAALKAEDAAQPPPPERPASAE